MVIPLNQEFASQPPPGSPHGAPAFRAAPLCAFLVAAIGHLPVLRTYWSQDDWGLLARAVGMQPEHGVPARILTQVLYWRALHPIFGLHVWPWAVTRLLLHGGSAALLVRIARRAGMSAAGSLVAGLLLAISPVALAPLWSANAVQDLLALFLALAATECWLAAPAAPHPGRTLAGAGVLGAAAMLAKENAFGLPFLWGAILLAGGRRVSAEPPASRLRSRAGAWLVIAALLAVAAAEAVVVLRHFDVARGSTYALGGPLDALFNALIYGVWLAWPWPFYPATFPLGFYAAGLAFWGVWAGVAAWQWRRGDRLVAAGGVASLLALAPMLPLRWHTVPYMIYPATAGLVFALAALVPRRPAWSRLAGVILSAVALGCSLGLMSVWLTTRTADGEPRDPLVATTQISRGAIRSLRAATPEMSAAAAASAAEAGESAAGGTGATGAGFAAPAAGGVPIVLLQVPPDPRLAAQADRMDARMVMNSRLYTAIGGEFGPRLAIGQGAQVHWANRLDGVPPQAIVFVEDGRRFRWWGGAIQARFYLALTEVALGEHAGAARALWQAAQQSGRSIPFYFDPAQMIVPAQAIRDGAASFEAFLAGDGVAAAGLTPAQGDVLRPMFRELLGVVAPKK